MTLLSRSLQCLNEIAESGDHVDLWWRDDDAQMPTDPLSRLLELRASFDVPLALAVIPDGVDPSLAAKVSTIETIGVFAHGWRHANYAPSGQKRSEFGDHRPVADMDEEARQGREILSQLFGVQFHRTFVPPWNRIGENMRLRIATLGFSVLSIFGPARNQISAELNTHIDVMNWRAMEGLSPEELDHRLSVELKRHRTGTVVVGEPIGLLTHHLQHDERAWQAIESLLGLLARHPAVRWPTIGKLTASAEGSSVLGSARSFGSAT